MDWICISNHICFKMHNHFFLFLRIAFSTILYADECLMWWYKSTLGLARSRKLPKDVVEFSRVDRSIDQLINSAQSINFRKKLIKISWTSFYGTLHLKSRIHYDLSVYPTQQFKLSPHFPEANWELRTFNNFIHTCTETHWNAKKKKKKCCKEHAKK